MQKTGRVAFEKKKEISFHITSHHSSKPPQEEGEERKDDPENAKMETGKTRGCTSPGVAPTQPEKRVKYSLVVQD